MNQLPKGQKTPRTYPAQFISNEIKELVHTHPANRLPFFNDYVIFNEPLVKFADGDDPLFSDFKRIISPFHLTPREALAQAYNKGPQELPERLSVISWILPIAEETRKSMYNETRIPSRLWSHTRWYGEKFNDKIRAHVVDLLIKRRSLATAPMLHPYFKINSNEKGAYSNWSERHIAYAAGHGTFSLSDGFITDVGIAHRCGSLVTDLVLPVNSRTARSPYSNCLFYQGVKCNGCIRRCPAGAITENGHDKNKCQKYMHDHGYGPVHMQNGYDNIKSTIGCGFCQTKVPCEYINPAKILKKKTA
jgi:epoxyqueuosine reductase